MSCLAQRRVWQGRVSDGNTFFACFWSLSIDDGSDSALVVKFDRERVVVNHSRELWVFDCRGHKHIIVPEVTVDPRSGEMMLLNVWPNLVATKLVRCEFVTGSIRELALIENDFSAFTIPRSSGVIHFCG